MSLRRKILIAFVVTLFLGGITVANWIKSEARASYAHVIENMLVDNARLIAAELEFELARNGSPRLDNLPFMKVFSDFRQRRFEAPILSMVKHEPSIDLIVTDKNGFVVYSSRDPEEVGTDFSKWRDVALSLKGQHGARSSRLEANDRRTTAYFVGAPIRLHGVVVGQVSVLKTRASLSNILDFFFYNIIQGVIVSVLMVLAFGALLMMWITKPIDALRKYALEVSKGRRAPLPDLPHRELRDLGRAFEEMRVTVEGRKTSERFVQSLTHELKSPISAIRASAELAQEAMTNEQRSRFLKNIEEESLRVTNVLEKMLYVAAIESRVELKDPRLVDLKDVWSEVVSALASVAEKRGLKIEAEFDKELAFVEGDRFLLVQAFRNLLENALDFSSDGAVIRIEVRREGALTVVRVLDQGSGIPEFAQDKVFEKFFSLERPSTGKKGTGLGLSFVREVVALHKGQLRLVSPPPNQDHGTLAEVRF